MGLTRPAVTLLGVVLLLSPGPPTATAAPPGSSRVLPEEGWIRQESSDGSARILAGGAAEVPGATPEEKALGFLVARAADLGLDPVRLHHQRSVRTPAGDVVFFVETRGGEPVLDSQAGVLVDEAGRVRHVVSSLRSAAWRPGNVEWPDPQAARHAAEAEAAGMAWKGAPRILRMDRGWLAGRGEPAYRFLLADDLGPLAMVDCEAASATIRRTARIRRRATLTGWIFDPNPVNTLNDPFLADAGDARAAVPSAAYFDAQVAADDPSGGLYRLEGTYGFVADYPETPPDSPPATSAAPDGFRFWRDQNGFEDFNAYFWVTTSGEYVESLGFGLLNLPVLLDTHTDWDDGPFFFGVPRDAVSPGEPNAGIFLSDTCFQSDVDSGEDADVILHEHSHAIVHGLREVDLCWGPEGAAINEGTADYWAMSWSYATSINNGFDEHCLAEWWVVETDWCLRRTDSDKYYPDDLVGEEHADGEIWSRFLFDLAVQVGEFVTVDEILLTAVTLVPINPSFLDAVDAMVAADVVLNGGANAASIRAAAAGRGITVRRPPEVSPPGGAFPLRLAKLPGGLIRLLWQDLGVQADAYNIYEGEIPDWGLYWYAACGIPGTPGPPGFLHEDGTADFPGAFFLVTATANGMEGPAGCGWDGIFCWERNPSENWCAP